MCNFGPDRDAEPGVRDFTNLSGGVSTDALRTINLNPSKRNAPMRREFRGLHRTMKQLVFGQQLHPYQAAVVT